MVDNNFLCRVGNTLTLYKESSEQYKHQVKNIEIQQRQYKEKKIQADVKKGKITEKEAVELGNIRTKLEEEKTELRNLKKNLEEELDKCSDMDWFFEKYPQFQKDWDIYLKEKKIKVNNAKRMQWSSLFREWRHWDSFDLEHMYARTLRLAKIFNSRPIAKLKTDYGNLANNDITTKVLRLVTLSRELQYGIYPELEASLNFESVTEEIQSQEIRGTINWNKTIINSAQTGGMPLNFVCKIRKNNFDIPENRLLMLAIFWIHNDCEEVLRSSAYPGLAKEERVVIGKIYNTSKIILERTSLQNLRLGVEELSHKRYETQKELIGEVKKRKEAGLIQQYSYYELLNWIAVFAHFNTRKFLGLPEAIRMDVKETTDDMFEYWILYEFALFLKEQKQLSCNIYSKREKEIVFKIKSDQKEIKLVFSRKLKREDGYELQVRDSSYIEPDYIIETKQCVVPIVMDAKNYSDPSFTAASERIVSYLVDLNLNDVKTGILFFPRKLGEDDSHQPIYSKETEIVIKGHPDKPMFRIFRCSCISGNHKETKKNFDLIFEKYLKPYL